MQVTISTTIRLVTAYIKAKLVPFIEGSPGIGKSEIVKQIAKEYKLKVIDVRLSQCDPTDLLGFPDIHRNQPRPKAGYVPMETFPIEGDPIPDGYAGWLVFLDEFNSAPLAVQAAAYKLVLDRMVGIHPLHQNVAIVCAGNREQDNAIVQPMSTALQSRLAHIELVVNANEFVDWGQRNGIHHWITDYIQFKPGQVYTFMPDHTDKTYACPRTWEFANRILKLADSFEDRLALLTGVISEGVAREFLKFCEIYESLPKPAQLIADPDGVAIPREPSILYALTGTLSHNATKDNFDKLMRVIKRLPVEFQVVTMREAVRRDKTMMSHPAVQGWITDSAIALF